jgi:FAD/FMN-containing dehydrogenase
LLADDLVRVAKGEVLSDDWSRRVYSVDASHYEIEPVAVACPMDAHDVQEIMRYAVSKKIPVTGRGAGTGLLGQALSENGLVLDFSKHMNKIVETGDDYVVVQPGIVKAALDKELKKKGKFLPPDPASNNYCTIGGMIADNSSGVHCLGYGNTIDFIDAVDLAYADGSAGHASVTGYDEKMSALKSLLEPYVDLVHNSYPKVNKNSCGYRLDAVIADKFQPQKILAASEGTLALVTSARFRIMDIPENRCLLVLGFEDLVDTVSAAPAILQFFPVALELLDHTVFLHSKSAEKGSLLYVEFAGKDAQTLLEKCRQKMTGLVTAVEYASDEQSLTKIWAARKGALNNIMKMTVGSRKPIGLVEDTVVPPSMLAEHTQNIVAAYREYGLQYVMYGHVGDGNLHTRPIVDVLSKSESEMINNLARRIFSQVIQKGGTITGEHGDGLARVGYIEMMYGKKLTSLFRQVKELFDSDYLLNPGKKVPIV